MLSKYDQEYLLRLSKYAWTIFSLYKVSYYFSFYNVVGDFLCARKFQVRGISDKL